MTFIGIQSKWWWFKREIWCNDIQLRHHGVGCKDAFAPLIHDACVICRLFPLPWALNVVAWRSQCYLSWFEKRNGCFQVLLRVELPPLVALHGTIWMEVMIKRMTNIITEHKLLIFTSIIKHLIWVNINNNSCLYAKDPTILESRFSCLLIFVGNPEKRQN